MPDSVVSAQLQPEGAGRALLSGDLTLATVVDLLPRGLSLLGAAGPCWTVNLAGVNQVSGAGVALLLEWLRAAMATGKTLRIEHLPEHMLPIIRISDLEPLFEPVLVS